MWLIPCWVCNGPCLALGDDHDDLSLAINRYGMSKRTERSRASLCLKLVMVNRLVMFVFCWYASQSSAWEHSLHESTHRIQYTSWTCCGHKCIWRLETVACTQGWRWTRHSCQTDHLLQSKSSIHQALDELDYEFITEVVCCFMNCQYSDNCTWNELFAINSFSNRIKLFLSYIAISMNWHFNVCASWSC